MMLQAVMDSLSTWQPVGPWSLRWHWPWALALLLAAPWIGPCAGRTAAALGSAAAHGAREPQPPRLPPAFAAAMRTHARRSSATSAGDRWCWALAWTLLVLALAQPHRPGELAAAPVSGRALALAIDLSGSMERTDFELDEQPSDRLSVVKRLATDFLSRREGDRVGLVLFGKQAFIGAPLTFDLNALADTLAAAGIGMAGRSTAIGDGLGLALSMLKDDPAGGKAVILLSDGTNNAGEVEPEDAAGFAATLGIRVHTIAMGSETLQDPVTGGTRGYATKASADLDEATLQAVADRAGGRFFRVRDTAGLKAVYRQIDALESSRIEAPPARLSEEWRHLPLVALLLLLVLRSSGSLRA